MKNNRKLFIPLIAFALVALIAVAVMIVGFPNRLPSAPEMKRFDASFLELFDTVSVINGYDVGKESFAAVAQEVHDTLLAYHNLYNIDHTNDVAASIQTINDNAGIQPVQVDRRIIDLLKVSKELHAITGGRTNVAFGAVLRIWHAYREEGIDDPQNASLPPQDALRE